MKPTVQQMQDIQQWLSGVAPAGAELVSDSRKVKAGDVFFAYPGDAADGRAYIEQALENGASAVLYESHRFTWDGSWSGAHRAVSGLKQLSGQIAHTYYGQADHGMLVVAVTGTNGKTSCTQWLGHALSHLGQTTGVIGTLGTGIYSHGQRGAFEETGNTTPDALLLQQALSSMRQQGVSALAIEASSIGLEQGRMNGTHVDIALFTNFTRDHLDYHGDEQHYEAAKRILFDWPGLQQAVINLDDAMGLRLVKHLQQKSAAIPLIGYTCEALAAPPGVAVLRASAIRTNAGGTAFHVDSPFGSAQVKTHLVGQFNVSNALGILGVLLAKGVAWVAALHAIELLVAVPGRMQQFGGHDAPLIVIDYAHTPDALEKTLNTLRQVAQQRHGGLWCVFGCGGDRDPGKRPQMGAVAELADHVIVTSDNPRSEEPGAIIAQILAGMKAPQAAQALEDRAAAILWAVRHAGKADVVLLAGKGHETYQEIKGKKLPFLDADHTALALAARATMKGGNI
ncbi:UDP-N-acetylmuramoyl-L-alanyl-D-glutamate--2,6-diaminopimelate ligase [Collimonas sp.]|jgi:UDP-N-acetylmuramoyl-L-alanyl-D-glutamate--2,6-diaminopimelate ligase|uniref:UDP-N-acetylmuramoyl-L-alanyl-D-glutamate--2, 6-diaminopimelate ligase n=1 Tax=Collimonas sp. TaxID=1963772 RepID=UPI002BCF3C3F|nr:UDP-N-acetylmuramoyl-L-alanyl-D-glutamate--2,6-diaminopimelate ligase [Collimonas sp.]HWW04138.1 UDP-N-acetylmuramoyl-L-alanyl-D-glutamate--2,6-diaminopimelate ligase [Collimonas sp.]